MMLLYCRSIKITDPDYRDKALAIISNQLSKHSGIFGFEALKR
jgi:hypothetical protein